MLCHLKYKIDKEYWRNVFYENIQEGRWHWGVPKRKELHWYQLFVKDNSPLKPLFKDIENELGIYGMNNYPRFSYQFQNTRVEQHLDEDFGVKIQFNLLETIPIIHIKNKPYPYEAALIDVGHNKHGVEKDENSRLILQFYLRHSWKEVYDRLNKKGLIDQEKTLSINPNYQSYESGKFEKTMVNAFEIPEFKFDSEKLKQIYLSNKKDWAQYGKNENTSLHTQYVSKEDVLEHISQLKNYNELIENVKFFKTLKNGKVGPHTDKRKVAINIPVIIGKTDKVTFYEGTEKEEVFIQVKGEEKQTTAKKYKNPKLIETFVSDKVFCLNTRAIHGVINESNTDRIILSISFKEKYDDYKLIKYMYNNGQLI